MSQSCGPDSNGAIQYSLQYVKCELAALKSLISNLQLRNVSVTKASLQLDNVDNTHDIDKIVSNPTKSYVDGSLAAINTDYAGLASKTYVDSSVSGIVTDIAGKADVSYVNSSIASVNTSVAGKADLTYVNTSLSNKLDLTKKPIVTTVAGLRTLTVAADVLYQNTDLAGGQWYYDASDTTTADNTGTVLVTGSGQRLKRIFSGDYNAQWFGILPSNTASQNDTAIAATLAALPPGGATLYFPAGTYQHTGITIITVVNIVGHSKWATQLLNVGAGTASVTINAYVERSSFRNISVWGNGGHYGAGATAGKGFVFANFCAVWDFDNVWMRGHGGAFFYADGNGDVNNMNITNCELEYGGDCAIHLIGSDPFNEINAINIENCNIANFANNGVEIWGASITVQNCAIQDCGGVGITVDGSMGSAQVFANGIRIDNNYFELCVKGFITLNSVVINPGSSALARYIIGCAITNNFGNYGKYNFPATNPLLYSCVTITAPRFTSWENIQVGGLVFMGNSFGIGGGADACYSILNANNVLSYDAVIQRSTLSGTESQYVNLGRAQVLSDTLKTGIGTPEGVVTAPTSSLYRRTDGAVGSMLYQKQTGTGNTGWVAIALPPPNLSTYAPLANPTFTGTVNTGKIIATADIVANSLTVGLGAGSIASNTALGNFSLYANTTGINNVGVGPNTLVSNTTGGYNTAIGPASLYANTSGSSNIGISNHALFANTTGGYNLALGYSALAANITGNYNIGIGYNSLINAISNNNIAIGANAGADVTTGGANLIVGYNSGRGLTTGNYNTIIGDSVTGLAAGLSNTIIIADGQGNQRIVANSTGVTLNGIVTATSFVGSGTSLTGLVPFASPTFTGTPTLPTGTIAATQTAGNNTTAIATTAFVQAAVTAGVTGVTSVFGRTGAVVAATNDYTFAQIGTTPTTIAGYGITDAFILPALTSGNVLFSNGTTISQNAKIFWDNTNLRLGVGTNTPGANFESRANTALTTSASNAMTLNHRTSGTAANGFGLGVLYELESSTTYDCQAAQTIVAWADATHATRRASINQYLISASGSPRLGVSQTLNADQSTVNIGLGVAAPTAMVHITAGTAAAGTAPLKLTSGVNLTTPENGAIEFDGTHYYATVGTTRYQLDNQTTNFAPLTSPTFTGTPTLPTGTIAATQTTGNNTTAIATTAFVQIASKSATATNDNATAGNLGEYISSLVAVGSPISFATATTGSVTSISLTAGDWDVSGNINYIQTGATVTQKVSGINIGSLALPTDGSEVYNGNQLTTATATDSSTIETVRVSIAATTTIYLVGKATFSAGTVSAFGKIRARRVR